MSKSLPDDFQKLITALPDYSNQEQVSIYDLFPQESPVGLSIVCKVCGRQKKPIGRDAPLAMANGLCDSECEGYYNEPKPGYLWPGECRNQGG
jgi:hypothetical protein